MERLKKYLACTVLTGTLILVLVISAGNWIVNAGNDGRSLEDYTSPKKTYYDTDFYEDEHLFKAAAHFHLFASDQIALPGSHCNGNFAAPNVDVSAVCGTNQADREMSYAGKLKCSQLKIASSDFALGKSNTTLTDKNGSLSVGPISENQIYINGAQMDIGDHQKIYLAPDKFIDFAQEFTYLRDVSKAMADLKTTLQKGGDIDNPSQAGTYNLENNNRAYIYLANGVNVLNCKISDIKTEGSLKILGMLCNKNSNEAQHAFTGSQSLIINVDCKGTTNANPGLETKYQCQCNNGWPHGHGEGNYYPGTIVIWNFYDSSKTNKLYTGTLAPSKAVDGCYLVPNGEITISHNANGTLIGKKITIAAESHRADFKGAKPKLDLTTSPSTKPSASPSAKPSTSPSTKPTASASAKPSTSPSTKPTASASAKPSTKPTASASAKPTAKPTASASTKPTAKPTASASTKPSAKPTASASTKPSAKPSVAPSENPSFSPSWGPIPTQAPSQQPTVAPGNTPTAPSTTEVPVTQAPEKTPQATAPSMTTTPTPPTATKAAPTAAPKKTKAPSDKNNKKTPKKGNLHITVTDSQTGAVVPGATVKITKPNGTTKTYTTDKKGQIKLEKTAVGKYKGVVTKVPKGYHADRTKFTSKVKAATTTKEKVRIKTGVSAGRKTKTNSKVSSNTTTTTSQPKTGDSFNIKVPIILFLLAFVGIITAIVLKKRSYYYYK